MVACVQPPVPTWAKAARIIFALAPSSAASERVFSLVTSMFGIEQLTAMADFVQGSSSAESRILPHRAAHTCTCVASCLGV